ncbi:MAG TPA: hypothetical protein VKV21_15210 [Solirubrobacteraceae bacterium]|nr:hypothetical protein [Solirubrobacteraceae bacterium]
MRTVPGWYRNAADVDLAFAPAVAGTHDNSAAASAAASAARDNDD